MSEKHSPAKALSDMMTIIYDNNLTSISGGNLSIKLDSGDVYVTPSGGDKGSLAPEDINCICPDGKVTGPFKPSLETPFHLNIYRTKPEVCAVIHAHAPSLLGISLQRSLPPIDAIPHLADVIGKLDFAPYDIPGGEVLGEKIAAVFNKGADFTIMENHGVVLAGSDINHAYYRLEALNLFAQAYTYSRVLGEPIIPLTSHNELWKYTEATKDAEAVKGYDKEIGEIDKYMKRIYKKQLSLSNPELFCITYRAGEGMITNRKYLPLYELVRNTSNYSYVDEASLFSHHQKVHMAIYKMRPDINCIITGLSPHVMAFAITHTPFQTNLIPESYLVLQEVADMKYDDYGDIDKIAAAFEDIKTNEIIFENGGYLCAGPDVMKIYDRVEVLEYSSRAAIEAQSCGKIEYLDNAAIKNIIKEFDLPE